MRFSCINEQTQIFFQNDSSQYFDHPVGEAKIDICFQSTKLQDNFLPETVSNTPMDGHFRR